MNSGSSLPHDSERQRPAKPEPSADNLPERFIFRDLQGKRWPRLKRGIAVAGLLLIGALVWFFQSLLVRPELRVPESVRSLRGQFKAQSQKLATTNEAREMNWQKFYSESPASLERLARIREQLRPGKKTPNEVRLGFYTEWDPNSFVSLEEHAGSLTHVAPEWFTLSGAESNLLCEPEPRLTTFAAARGLAVMPILHNLVGDDWQPEAVENLALGSAEKRSRFIETLLRELVRNKAAGVIIDWEQIDPAYKDAYTSLIEEMASALQSADKEIWLMVPMGDEIETFDLETLALTIDRFVAVMHDENSEHDAPGPIASLPWFEGWLKVLAQHGAVEQWVAVLGSYAYDWNTTRGDAETISFRDAMSRASYAGVDAEGSAITVQAPTYNGTYNYSEPGGEHTVTFLDAISFHNQLRAVRAAKLGGIGVARLGTEDPQLWELIDVKEKPSPGLLRSLSRLRADLTITHVGRGEIVSVDDARDNGHRNLWIDEAGLLAGAYTDFPTYPILYHQGAGGPDKVAITFDDGPDPKWTPRILDILKERGVKAGFFLVGANCEQYPRLVARIVAEGHEIGNHTYTHGNLATMSPALMRFELNATERLIQAITGRSTSLFRPPYNADSTPSDISELAPLKLAQNELGYTIVLERIDPQDWARPGADTIVERVKELRGEGNIVLLHDAGGDRSQTVEALPKIIDYLETRGDQIVPLSTLLGLTRDEVMPPIKQGSEDMVRVVTGTGFRLGHAFVEFFWAFMIVATALLLIRTLVVARLAHRQYSRGTRVGILSGKSPASPPLSIVIAAFNEEKVIDKTLRSVLVTDYRGEIEVVVVDDGSKDDTSGEVARVAATEPRIRLVSQPNRGKAAALRNGLSHARHGLLVFLDADTLFERSTLGALAKPFANPLIGAVSGNARVGNTRTIIGKCQSLEYICGFNLDRRAYTEWNCITVVPGAVSAFRRSAILAAGGFSHDTLAEDTDLTLTLHRLGYRIDFADDAVAWTEAPETVGTLVRQRFRWAFGTMQCLWKHRDLVFNPRFGALGWFALPGIWFFQIALVALTPVVDGILIVSLISGYATAIWGYFAAFIGVELILAALACWMEGERLRNALWIIPMRFLYRPLLAWVIWKSIVRALKGAFVGWGKLERTGAVEVRA